MTKMLICPKCGEYQEDTTNTRKVGVAAKKAGMWIGQFAMKSVTKMAASALGGDDHYSQYAAGSLGKEAANFLGINPDKVSIDDVKYKCSSCKHYWTGQDMPEKFNEIQNQTVIGHHQNATINAKGDFQLSLFGTIFSIVGICLSLWIWSARHSYDYINMFGYPSTNYSWHYYIFWPMILIFASCTLYALGSLGSNYDTYQRLKKKSDLEYAREDMNLGNN